MDINKAHGLYKLFKQTDEGARQKQVYRAAAHEHTGSSLRLYVCTLRRSLVVWSRDLDLEPALKPRQQQQSKPLPRQQRSLL